MTNREISQNAMSIAKERYPDDKALHELVARMSDFRERQESAQAFLYAKKITVTGETHEPNYGAKTFCVLLTHNAICVYNFVEEENNHCLQFELPLNTVHSITENLQTHEVIIQFENTEENKVFDDELILHECFPMLIESNSFAEKFDEYAFESEMFN